jgi:hypothetical protein
MMVNKIKIILKKVVARYRVWRIYKKMYKFIKNQKIPIDVRNQRLSTIMSRMTGKNWNVDIDPFTGSVMAKRDYET